MMLWPSDAVRAVSPEWYRQLDIRPGITAIIGSGGKTSLMLRLCEELPGSVIVCTSTHIWMPDTLPLFTGHLECLPAEKCCAGSLPLPGGAEGGRVKSSSLAAGRAALASSPQGEPVKLTAPADSFAYLAELADYVLVEADGSRGLPLKAHGPHEPVIPEGCRQIIQVLGLTGLNRPIADAVHRPERFAALSGCGIEEAATPERAAAVLRAENLCTHVFLNQADTEREQALARELASLLPYPTVIGALAK